MTLSDKLSFWLESAKRDKKTADVLFSNDDYHWCLFFWHLVLEKTLKAIILNLGKEMPITHNLLLLAKEAGIAISEKDAAMLKEITSFNLEARYDDYKLSFYKKATKQYARHWVTICNKYVSQWETLL